MTTPTITTNNNEPRKLSARHRSFSGTVVSISGVKTIRVAVNNIKEHPKYHKQYVTREHFAVHDEKSLAKVGNVVTFEECRPLSRTKRWRLVSVTNSKTA